MTEAGRPLYLFYHVPECAGTTLISHLMERAPDRLLRPKVRRGFLKEFGGGNIVRLPPTALTVIEPASTPLKRSLVCSGSGRGERYLAPPLRRSCRPHGDRGAAGSAFEAGVEEA